MTDLLVRVIPCHWSVSKQGHVCSRKQQAAMLLPRAAATRSSEYDLIFEVRPPYIAKWQNWADLELLEAFLVKPQVLQFWREIHVLFFLQFNLVYLIHNVLGLLSLLFLLHVVFVQHCPLHADGSYCYYRVVFHHYILMERPGINLRLQILSRDEDRPSRRKVHFLFAAFWSIEPTHRTRKCIAFSKLPQSHLDPTSSFSWTLGWLASEGQAFRPPGYGDQTSAMVASV